MATTGQSAVDQLRIILAETEGDNSRWTDAQLFFYYNKGRQRFAEESQALKRIFQQTTEVGATLLGGNVIARYALQNTVWQIDKVTYDEAELDVCGPGAWDDKISGRSMDTQGLPFIYRRIGDSIDLFFSPSENKTLEVEASIIPLALAGLASTETELKDRQVPGVLDFAAAQALQDDDRDGTLYENRGLVLAGKNKKVYNRPGPRFVEQQGPDPSEGF